MDEIFVTVVDLPSSAPSSWDDLEKLFHHGFYNELRIAPEETPVLLTESAFANPSNRERLTQMMFETFNVPALAIYPSCVLSVYSTGLTTGLSIHAGETSTEIVPVVEGVPLRDIAVDYPVTGSYITGYLRKIVQEEKPDFNSREISNSADRLKEKLHVALDPTTEPEASVTEELYEGTVFDLKKNSWKTAELFLYPEFASVPHAPLVQTIISVISKCPDEIQKKMLNGIVLSGGIAEIKGFKERIEKDIITVLGDVYSQLRVNDPQPVKVSITEHPSSGPWIGASILGSLSDFVSKLMMKENYDEVGPTGIHSFAV